MRSTNIVLLIMFVFVSNLMSQAPQAFNYQGMARDENGLAVGSKEISLQVDIIKGSPNGEEIYMEQHVVTTNKFGIFSVRIGEGDLLLGDFESINWGSDQHYTRTSIDIDGGTDYVTFDAVQLYSVPYALYAAQSGNGNSNQGIQDLRIDGNVLSISEGNSIDLSSIASSSTDNDSDPNNEIQSIVLSDGILSLSNSNEVDLNELSSNNIWTEQDSSIYYTGNSLNFGNNSGLPVFTIVENPQLGAFVQLGGNPNNGTILMAPSLGIQAIDAEGQITTSIGDFLGQGYMNVYSDNILKAEMSQDFNRNGLIATYSSEEQQLVGLESNGNNGAIYVYADDEEVISLESEDGFGASITLKDENLNTSSVISSVNGVGQIELFNNSNELLKLGRIENDLEGYSVFQSFNDQNQPITEIGTSNGESNGFINIFGNNQLKAALSTNQTESTSNGKIEIFDEEGFGIASLQRSQFGDGGALQINHRGNSVVDIQSNSVDAGSITTSSKSGDRMISLSTRNNGDAGHANVYRNDKQVVELTSSPLGGGFVITFDTEEEVSNTIGTFEESGNGYIGTHNDSTIFATYITGLESGEGFIETKGSNGNSNIRITSLQDHSNHGFVAVQDSEGETQVGMYVDTDGKGVIFADEVNSFVENPNKSGEYHMFSTVQGPEQVYFIRGTSKIVNGKCDVDFPIYFQNVIAKSGMTVMMTPLSASSKGLSVIQKNVSGFQVQELLEGKGNYEFDWEIKAVRKKYLKKSFGKLKTSKESIAKIPNLTTVSIKE